jgi:ABC-2 type transport system ATP-binding protein
VGGAIEIDDVSKHFKLYREKPDSLKERIVKLGRIPYEEFWALRDIDIDVKTGETVGLLGHNGSGKSTLLKCVAGILRPTRGTIRTSGRLAALLELGAGFHPELTGRENVYLNGSILGLSKNDIDLVFDDIVAFAEMEPFIDNQVKHYSSGMYARLAFAVAVNVEPEILLIDEVLSVGDEAFQRRSLERVKRFQKEGRTILLVTHAPDMIRQICDRAAVLDRGSLVTIDAPGKAVLAFRDALLQRGIDIGPETNEDLALRSNEQVRITGAEILYPDPSRSYVVSGEPVAIVLQYHAPVPIDDVVFAMSLHDQRGNLVLGTNTDVIGSPVDSVHGDGEIVFEIRSLPLLEGLFELSLGIHDHDGGISYDHRAEKEHLEVMNPGRSQGLVSMPIDVEVRRAHR